MLHLPPGVGRPRFLAQHLARRCLPLGLLLAVAPLVTAAEEAMHTPEVDIVGTTPLPGIGLPRAAIAATVRTATAHDLERSGSTDLGDFLNRNVGSVLINEVQGNPFQPDLSYRGYTASPLLGTPQGLSIYMDGVRLNQPFGDVVLWDLIPRAAISSLNLMSGANPLFGLNTLGGALSLQTKNGLQNPGTRVEALAGSYGRGSVQFEHGGSNAEGWHWYATGNSFRDNGWRDDSTSRLGQIFGKLGWQDASTDLSLTYSHADSELYGNGMQEAQLLAERYASVYTKPDITKNHGDFLNLEGRRSLNDNLLLSGNAYYRNTRSTTFNGDINEGALGESVYYTGQNSDKNWLLAHGYTPGIESSSAKSGPGLPMWRCIAQAGMGGEPNEKCSGLLNSTRTRQQNYGLSGQLTLLQDGPDYANQLLLGAGYDASRVKFDQSSQFGYLNADHSITPVAAWADGSQNSENAFDQRVALDGKVSTWSLFASDTLTWQKRWNLTLSGRYNQTRLKNSDQLYPYNNATTQGEQRGSLDGEHRFTRFNPALGLTYSASPALNVFAGYSESSRAPTSIELGCADPNFGCRLPNSMAGDPALKQVVSRSWEAGLRGSLGALKHWGIGLFRADNADDILFVAHSAATGYFRNFGKTRRQGLEISAAGRIERLSLSANYTYLQATYQSAETVNSPFNSAADSNGFIAISPGKRLPLLPSQMLKLRADYQLTPQIETGLDLLAVNAAYVRGNDNNVQDSGGKVPGHTVANWSGSYQASPATRLFANVSNLFDRRYASAGQLGPLAFAAGGAFTNSDSKGTTFYSPGAPRIIWLGVQHSFK